MPVSRTAAIVAALCFSRYGDVVEAKNTRIEAAPAPCRQSVAAALTASVRLSSSWLATAFSPPADAVPHSFAITSRGKR